MQTSVSAVCSFPFRTTHKPQSFQRHETLRYLSLMI